MLVVLGAGRRLGRLAALVDQIAQALGRSPLRPGCAGGLSCAGLGLVQPRLAGIGSPAALNNSRRFTVACGPRESSGPPGRAK